MRKAELAAIEAVAERYGAALVVSKSKAPAYLKIPGKRIAIEAISFKDAEEPRLRFDKVAVGLIERLQTAISESVPKGKTVVVMVTAPIWQDSKTGAVLIERIRRLLATRRSQLRFSVHGNRIQVHVLKGGGERTPKVLGFVHNPRPSPALLFEVTRSLLACMRSAEGGWLVIADQDGSAPIKTIQQVCKALRASASFKRILVAGEGVRAL